MKEEITELRAQLAMRDAVLEQRTNEANLAAALAAELRAHLASANATIESLSDHGSGAERMRFIDALQKQVERLTKESAEWEQLYHKFGALSNQHAAERDTARAEVERLRGLLGLTLTHQWTDNSFSTAEATKETIRTALTALRDSNALNALGKLNAEAQLEAVRAEVARLKEALETIRNGGVQMGIK